MAKKLPFSKLEPDDKTFGYACMYYEIIEKSSEEMTKELFAVDMKIQQIELEEHLKRCGKESDAEECVSWMDANAENLRVWLNSLKEITLFMHFDNAIHYRTLMVRDLFNRFVALYNSKQGLINTIRL